MPFTSLTPKVMVSWQAFWASRIGFDPHRKPSSFTPVRLTRQFGGLTSLPIFPITDHASR